jgi:RNA polymerase sigma-70 factor (ECF subfamily)
VLDTLTPAERLAFVLHDMFAVPFEEIAPVVERSLAATRQLASRARRRVQQAGPDAYRRPEVSRKRAVVDAFLAASREGDFEALLAMLDPDIVLRADDAVARMGADREVVGARAVAGIFCGGATSARPALIDGAAGAIWMQGGRLRVVFTFTITSGKVAAIEMISDPERLGQLEVIPD